MSIETDKAAEELINKIHAAYHYFQGKPEAIYLGYEEVVMLRAGLRTHYLVREMRVGAGGLTLLDVPVIQVNLKNYFRVI